MTIQHATLAAQTRTELDKANKVYRAAYEATERLSLLALAHEVLAAHPTATHLRMEPSDQGEWMTPDTIILRDGEESIETDEVLDDIWDLVSNLTDHDGCWEWFVDKDHSQQDHYKRSIDLQQVLDNEGDYRRLLPQKEES